MPSYRKRPRKILPPPLAGGGEQPDAQQTIAWEKRLNPTQRSRELRTQASEAEQKLWRYLRRKTVHSYRFRRQFPLGPYFADFCCFPVRLIIEVDGNQHTEAMQAVHDARRTAWLNRNSFHVIRFAASDVMTSIGNVLEEIERVVSQQERLLRYLGSPLPLREGANSSAVSARIWGRGETSPEPNAPSPNSLSLRSSELPPPAGGGGKNDTERRKRV
jgi:very-short-patch-repair endonuclease